MYRREGLSFRRSLQAAFVFWELMLYDLYILISLYPLYPIGVKLTSQFSATASHFLGRAAAAEILNRWLAADRLLVLVTLKKISAVAERWLGSLRQATCQNWPEFWLASVQQAPINDLCLSGWSLTGHDALGSQCWASDRWLNRHWGESS